MYYIKDVARLTGLSHRTIRHYDNIGLVSATRVEDNSYRVYDKDSIFKLKEIIFFKELDFSLDEIKTILTSKKYNRIEILKEQKKLLILKKNRYDTLISSIEETISNIKEGKELEKKILNVTNTFEAYKGEVLKKYGKSREYKEFKEKNYSNKDLNQFDKESKEIFINLASYMPLGFKDEKVVTLIKEWQNYITTNFYTCTDEILLSLANIYVDDNRFKKNFDKIKPGLAKFFSDSIRYYLSLKKVK